MSIRKIAFLGANGDLGSVVLPELARVSTFEITVLKRSSSTSSGSEYPKSIKIATVSGLGNKDELKKVLQGQDAVVACIPVKDVDEHLCLAEAAAEAGVKRFIPADFGSADSSSQRAQELLKLFVDKTKIRKRLVELALEHENFTWTSLVCGHFFDWMLKNGWGHVYFDTRSMDMIDSGMTKFSTTSLQQVGRATAAVLQNPNETKNKLLYIQSFCITQQDLLESLMKATGGEWNVNFVQSDKMIEECRGKGDSKSIEDMVFVLGMVDGNWESKRNFANRLLGLKEEDLDLVVRKTLEEYIQQRSK